MTGQDPANTPGAAPPAMGLPVGTAVELDPEAVVNADGSIFGGSPARLMRLSAIAQAAFAELRAGTVRTPAGSALARRLSDAGVLHPRPSPVGQSAGTVTVVIPVRDRAAELDRCLAALLAGASPVIARVIVVDDASEDPGAVARVAERHGAVLLRRPVNGGPGAARNTGLAEVTTPLVAFCDSDCLPSQPWIDALAGHFTDPLVAAAAPRIVGAGPEPVTFADRFAQARSALDLGALPARVAPMTRVSYVPTAALMVRRQALNGLGGAHGFDEGLRYGEDVDLVWRLIAAGWRIRYDPSVRVGHLEPRGWTALLSRRFAYGTSAARLEDRHPGQVSPLILVAAPAASVGALLARRPVLALAGMAAGYLDIALTLRRAGRPPRGIVAPLARSVAETFVGCGRWTAQFAAPAALGLAALPLGPPRTRCARAAVIAGLLTAGPVREWRRVRPPIGVTGWTAAVLVDDAVYGAGVWAGSLRSGHARAVLPRWRWHLMTAATRPKAQAPAGSGGR